MNKLYDRLGDLCICGEGGLGKHQEFGNTILICNACECIAVRFITPIKEGNIPIEELVQQYTEEECDFTNMEWVTRVSDQYVQRMEDSQVRCLLHTFVEYYKNINKKTYISYKLRDEEQTFVGDGSWNENRVDEFLSHNYSLGYKLIITDLKVRWSDGTEINMENILCN